ncbi:MAG: RagB/SusD family nutrient uptake outer membrane protein [Bacteroidota bacterium]
MKIIKYLGMTAALVLFSLTACQDDFLDVAPTASLSQTELSSQAGLEGTLIGAYSMLLGRGGFYSDASNWFWGSVLGGDANKGTNAGDQAQVNEIQTYAAQPNNGSILQKYERSYEGVARANSTLKLIAVAKEVGEVPTDVINRIEAEARFLRGHYYFDLKKNFNDVPYVDETWDEVTLVSNNKDIFPDIEADFQFAFDNLPETQGQVGRANKWAAGAYLGKVLLFQEKWAEARTVLRDVVENGTTPSGQAYGLLDDYGDLWLAASDNSRETVFASQAAANTGTINNANPAMVLNFPHGSAGPARPGGCCGFFQPSLTLANSFRTEDGLPLLDESYNDEGNALTTDLGLSSGDAFTVDDKAVDPRLDHSVGRRGIPFLNWGPHPGFDWIRDQPYGGPYSPKKFMYTKDGGDNDGSSWTPGYTAINYKVIRFADVLLMLAEAEIETGDLGAGLELINRVRERAINSSIFNDTGEPAANYEVELYDSFANAEEAITALRFERKLELSGEGHRKYDLVRWGTASNELNAYLAYENSFLTSPFSGATFTSNNDEFLPIPQNEIDLQGSDVIIQNPGY